MQFNGKPHPVMNCQFNASVYPPLPDPKSVEYREKYQKWQTAPKLLINLEIVFPRYYWRAQYLQEGNAPLYIVDAPVKGNAVLLKDCAFEDIVHLRLPNGITIRGRPEEGMPADMIRTHTAILEQEGLLRGNGDLKAALAEMQEQMRREHGQHAETLGRVEANGADIVAEARRLKEGKRQAEANRMGEALGALEMLMAGLEPDQRNLFLALKKADGNRTAAAKELGISQETVSKRLPALRKAFEEQKKEIPHFLLPRKGGRKGTPPKVYRETYKGGDIEEERTPFDEVAEKEESERGAE